MYKRQQQHYHCGQRLPLNLFPVVYFQVSFPVVCTTVLKQIIPLPYKVLPFMYFRTSASTVVPELFVSLGWIQKLIPSHPILHSGLPGSNIHSSHVLLYLSLIDSSESIIHGPLIKYFICQLWFLHSFCETNQHKLSLIHI